MSSGFDSQDFEGGKFSFYISEVINPLSEKETKSFELKVLDKGGNVQYYMPKPIDVTANVRASPFAYASV